MLSVGSSGVVHWVLQDSLGSEGSFRDLVAALEQLALPHSIHRVVPFTGDLDPDPSPVLRDPRVVTMGSFGLAQAAVRRGWRPGAWLDNLDFEIQRAHWGADLLNHDALVVPLGAIPEQPGPFFLRPVSDSKSFAGALYTWPAFSAWRDRLAALSPDDHPTVWLDTPVMLCSPKEISSETRTWVVDGQVVTASLYKVGDIVRGRPPSDVDPAVLSFAASRAAAWSPNRAYVMDIADTPAGLRIIEVNNLNSAGWYRADLLRLVSALEAMP